MSCVFLDIDGTLLDHDIGIQASTISAIHQAQANGHKICLATGRTKSEVDQAILDIGFDGYIYSCGSFVEVENTILFQHFMNIEDTLHILSLLHKYEIGFNLEGLHTSFLDEIAYSYFHDIFNHEDPTNSELAHQQMAIFHMVPFKKRKENDLRQVLKVAIFAHHHSVCCALQKELQPNLRLLLHSTQESKLINGEIFYHDISKATGMDHILQYFDIPLQRTIAIGDSMNDVDMIEHAQIGVAMGNACDELKRLSNIQTTSSKEDGIFHCFRRLHLIK